MKKIRLLLIEESEFYNRVLEEVVATNFRNVEIAGSVKSMHSALLKIEKLLPHILVLDFDLPEKDIILLLHLSRKKGFRIVFLSSLSDRLIEALRFSFVDFALKPFDVTDLIVAIDDAIASLEDKFYHIKIGTLAANINSTGEIDRLVVQGRRNTKVVHIFDIVEARSVDGGSYFCFSEGKNMFSPVPLRRYESILKSHGFIRCNSKTLINVAKVHHIDEENGFLYMENGKREEFEFRKTGVIRQLVNDYSFRNIKKLHA